MKGALPSEIPLSSSGIFPLERVPESGRIRVGIPGKSRAGEGEFPTHSRWMLLE